MSHSIEFNMFNEASGNILGIATAFITYRGRQKRVISAHLFTNKPAQISLELPRMLKPEELPQISAVISDFHAEMIAKGYAIA